jgi:hypothetical protein
MRVIDAGTRGNQVFPNRNVVVRPTANFGMHPHSPQTAFPDRQAPRARRPQRGLCGGKFPDFIDHLRIKAAFHQGVEFRSAGL